MSAPLAPDGLPAHLVFGRVHANAGGEGNSGPRENAPVSIEWLLKRNCSLSPTQDPVRFAQSPSLAFPPSTLENVQAGANGVPKVLVNFFGLLGPNGPMPIHFTEYARERERHFNDRTIASFINVFNHRLLSFFFRSWAASRKSVDLPSGVGPTASIERKAAVPESVPPAQGMRWEASIAKVDSFWPVA